MEPKTRWLLSLSPALLFFSPASAAPKVDVDVVVDMTPEGRKVPTPTPGHPAYYYPVLAPYQNMGAIIAGEPPPPSPHVVVHLVAVALAKQGYLLMHPAPRVNAAGQITYADGTVVTVPPRPSRREAFALNVEGDVPLTTAMVESDQGPYSLHRPAKADGAPLPLEATLRTVDPVHGSVMSGMPSLILLIDYGSMNPQIDTTSDSSSLFYNQNQMLALVGGNTLNHLDLDFEREPVMQGAEEDRYFVVVTAFDFTAYEQTKAKVMLWQAKMSVPGRRVYFGDVVAVLIDAGGPFFGRESYRPKELIRTATPEGQVKVGIPTVKSDSTAPGSP